MSALGKARFLQTRKTGGISQLLMMAAGLDFKLSGAALSTGLPSASALKQRMEGVPELGRAPSYVIWSRGGRQPQPRRRPAALTSIGYGCSHQAAGNGCSHCSRSYRSECCQGFKGGPGEFHSSIRRFDGLDPCGQHQKRQKQRCGLSKERQKRLGNAVPCRQQLAFCRIWSYCCRASGGQSLKQSALLSDRSADFWHKRSRESLWLSLKCKPTRVGSRLVPFDAGIHSGLEAQGSLCTRSFGEDAVEALCKKGDLEKALDILDNLSTAPSDTMYISLLELCAKRKALAQARRVRAQLAKHGLDSSKAFGEHLVSTLAKCGALEDALELFDRLTHRTDLSFTAMIFGYTIAGQNQKALKMSHLMRDFGVEPNKYTLGSLLRACGRLRDLKEGKRLHAEAVKHRCNSEMFVGTCLVDMYGKCGSIVDAQHAFQSLSQRDVVSWTAILSAHVQQDQAEKTLELYEQMHAESVTPNSRTFVIVFQACGLLAEKEEDAFVDGRLIKLKSLDRGKKIHVHAGIKGYDSDAFVASALVSMYGKCGSIGDAWNLFDTLSYHDVVSWTALLAAYAQRSQGEKVLQLYEKMQEEGVSPNTRSFVVVLQACGTIAEQEEHVPVNELSVKAKSLGQGKMLHAGVRRKGFDSDVFVGSTLITMYGKCCSIVDAENIFQQVSKLNVVPWNAMLVAYAQQCQAEKAVELYEQMRQNGVSPDIRTCVTILQACGMLAEKEDDADVDGSSIRFSYLEKGKALHADAWRRSYVSDVFVGSTMISMYGKCGSILDAQRVFEGLYQQNVVTWNAMLAVLVEHRQADKVLELYEQMQVEGVSADGWTFANAFQACGMLAAKQQDALSETATKFSCLDKGKALHARARRKCYDTDAYVGCTLINMYGKCGSAVDAHTTFYEIPHRSVVAWTALLSAYVEDGNGSKAFELYKQMQVEGVCLDDIALACILQSCSNTGNLYICTYIHAALVSTGDILSALVANALIHAYGRCGNMVDAQIVFDTLPQPNVISWTTLIAGYARQGDCVASLQCYEKMQLAGMKPNGVTFLSLLSACSHAGLVEKGVEYFVSMSRDHGITPDIEHYVSLVDLLGRSGYFVSVEGLLSTLPIQPDISMWLCLLGACRKHNNVPLARYAFNQAVHLRPNDSAPYLLMSNIYDHAGLRACSQEVKTMEQKSRAFKTPGQCWIEHNLTVLTFGVGQLNHPQLHDQQEFYGFFTELNSELDTYASLSGSCFVPRCLMEKHYVFS